jgi:hypothetical protein
MDLEDFLSSVLIKVTLSLVFSSALYIGIKLQESSDYDYLEKKLYPDYGDRLRRIMKESEERHRERFAYIFETNNS